MPSGREDPASRTPGRSAALHREVRQLLRVGRGRGTAVLVVSGEPGAGRTALLDAAVRRARAQGFRVLGTGLGPAWAARPYGAVIDLLGPLVADNPLIGRPTLTRRLAALDRLYGGPDRPTSTPLPDRAAEYDRLCTDVRRLLRRACVLEPLLLVVDDLQWADPSSIALLRQAVVQPAGLPLRVLVSVPTGGVADPFRGLEPAGDRPAPEHDHLALRRRRRAGDVEAWADGIIGSLDDPATEVLRLLGAAGGPVELGTLRAGWPADRLGPGLAALRAAGLVRVGNALDGWCRPRTYALAERAYDLLADDDRRRMHLRLLQSAHSWAPAETWLPAYHAARAGELVEPDARVALLARQAMAAADRYADATAVVTADAALAAVEAASEPVRRALLPQLLDLRAESLAATGRPLEAMDSWIASAALAMEGPSTTSARRYRRLAEAAWSAGRREEAGAHVERAAAALPASPPELEHLAVTALRARIRSQLAVGEFADIVAPLAELWRRTGWQGAEAEYKLALEALAPRGDGSRDRAPRRARAGRPPAQPNRVSPASATITAADTTETTS
ncbi:AAA family ATPase [Microlunatus ginsengisoli]|uniref:Orc1-like AAA ATPase domain-containing protein n=1 Tax=Microlunatus ginsengisoli TaxID=363863 RepID=A0ABP6ZU18_9ACTN